MRSYALLAAVAVMLPLAPAAAVQPANPPADDAAPAVQTDPVLPATTGRGLPPAVPMSPSADTNTYICEDGAAVEAQVDEAAGVLRVNRQGENYLLFETVGSTPPTYAAREATVRLRERGAILVRPHFPELKCPLRPKAPVAGTLWGTVTKLDRAALPAGTQVKVILTDTMRADAPAVEIASTEIRTAGNQVPLHFLIEYDAARIRADGGYGLFARMTRPDGTVTHVAEFQTNVLAGGQPQKPVELLVKPAGNTQ